MLTISLHLPRELQTTDSVIENFNNWDDFSSYMRRSRLQESYTVVFANIEMAARKEGKVVQVSKNRGYWIIELMKRNV